MAVLNNILQDFQDRLFGSVVSKRLVYNTCWEDPRIDRKLLDINAESNMVMLSSAGCNSFDYLLDNPKAIHCIDANPAQNALLELKKNLFLVAHFETLWHFLGWGNHPKASVYYQQNLASRLSEESRSFWDRHINYFSKNSNEHSFYYRGTSGKIALMIHNRIKHKGLYSNILHLLDSRTLSEQRYYYEEIEPQLWNTFYKWLLNRNTTMTMLGVPAAQRRLIDEDCEGGLLQFIRSSLDHVFTDLPIRDNYFWRVYLTGSYTPVCCPNYLKKKYFPFLRQYVQRIHQHTCHLSTFLKKHPGNYSHFVLLDHQDWLAGSQPQLLAEEWELILKNARPGARILFRSAGTNRSFLPDFVSERVDFNDALTNKLHLKDRVGTYGSTHLGVVVA